MAIVHVALPNGVSLLEKRQYELKLRRHFIAGHCCSVDDVDAHGRHKKRGGRRKKIELN